MPQSHESTLGFLMNDDQTSRSVRYTQFHGEFQNTTLPINFMMPFDLRVLHP